jgi:hypothetical protein
MWFAMKEFLLYGKGKGEMLTDDLIEEMCKIEIYESRECNKTIFDLAKKNHPNT